MQRAIFHYAVHKDLSAMQEKPIVTLAAPGIPHNHKAGALAGTTWGAALPCVYTPLDYHP